MGKTVFLGYDQRGLDREYDNRGKVADFADDLASYAKESEAVRAECAWVYENAGSFGGDPGRLFISGHSAGGHLVAMLMSTDWPALSPPDLIKAGCGISGLYDLEPIRLCFLNEELKLTPAEARSNSPVYLVPERSGPLLLAVVVLEGPEYHRQTDEPRPGVRGHERARSPSLLHRCPTH